MNNLDRDFKRIAKAGEVSDVSLRDLRRACSTHWALELPALVAKDLAGPSEIETTLRSCVSVRDEDRQRARDATVKALLLGPKQIQTAQITQRNLGVPTQEPP